MRKYFFILIALVLIAFTADLVFGSVIFSLTELWNAVIGSPDAFIQKEILFNHRLPKALTAILTGSGLAVAGVLMQTLFNNPLAGPDVLGVTSGASLGVALVTLSGLSLPFLNYSSGWGQVTAAVLGSIGVLLLIILIAMKVRQTISLLIVGLMIGYFTSAIVSILQNISNPDTLKLFVTWTFGSLSAVGWDQLKILFIFISLGTIGALLLQKPLNALLLGQNYAQGLGFSVKRLRILVILLTALLAGTTTAFTGPIAFIGITTPHIARGIFKTSNHRIVLLGSICCGSIIMLVCDLISQLPGLSGTLPINAVTALFGAPIIIYILLKK